MNAFASSPEFADCMDIIGQLSKVLTRKNLLLTTAESCTGGLLAAMCTEVPGSSAWFVGGVVAYANQVKRSVLHVPEEMLETVGAVSEQVVRRMAMGALLTCSAQLAVSLSGVAGPDGGSADKPVGTVWIGWALNRGPAISLEEMARAAESPEDSRRIPPVTIRAQHFLLTGNRSEIRLAACREALTGCLDLADSRGMPGR